MKVLCPLRIGSITKIAILLLALFAINSDLALSQDQTFPLPSTTGVLGVKSEAAFAEVVAFTRSTGASGWKDLYGTGILSYQDGEPHNVSLYLRGTEYSRLDIEMDSGTRSVRLNRSAGAFQDESGEQSNLLPVAARSAVVAFPKIWVEALNSKFVSLYDHGQFTATGQVLHRITIEYQLNQGNHNPGEPTVATDLYFGINILDTPCTD